MELGHCVETGRLEVTVASLVQIIHLFIAITAFQIYELLVSNYGETRGS